MSLPLWLDELITIVLVVGLIYMVTLLVRRAWLSVLGGLFDCALRADGATKWRPGLARYSGQYLEWYLVWHPWPRPTRLFVRDRCELVGFRDSDVSESKLGYAFARVVTLRARGQNPERWELAVNEGSATGLVSWLESAPPGRIGYRRGLDS
ncbi:MAG: DUF2550 domain-containing protein [Brooklawnia sp.]|uniref:DUF2550 domain-containing protein n=1 Tax=Brooklawnia sp. TaxID=2699740 RepID=UPI003C77FACE